jgi:chromosome condensin MukBEF ATPase and DNA-binding subunit MukB
MTTLFRMIYSLKSQLCESVNLSKNYEAKIKILVKKQKEEILQERGACEAVLKGLEEQLLKKKDELAKLHSEMKEQRTQLAAVIDKNTITQQYEEDSSLVKKLQKLLAEAYEQIHNLTQEQQTLTSQGRYFSSMPSLPSPSFLLTSHYFTSHYFI